MYIILKKKIQCHAFQRLRSCPLTIPDHSFVATHMLLSVQSVTFFPAIFPFCGFLPSFLLLCDINLQFLSSLHMVGTKLPLLYTLFEKSRYLVAQFFFSKTVAKDVLSVYEFLIILFKINFTEALLIPFLGV